MKFSLITTVLNEESSIDYFLDSIINQTKKPDDVVIVDGGSSDATLQKIKNFQKKSKNLTIKFISKPGNRSVGRNEGIRNTKSEIIAVADAGCILESNWFKKITDPFNDKGVDVVAGYYTSRPKNYFQKSLVPYVLVMPDRVNPDNFLPATRSMAFKKTVWEQLGGFAEEYSHNEDYIFARKLRQMNKKIIFEKDALVDWFPRNTFSEAFTMFFRFALGDAQAGIFRGKVILIFLRYTILFLLSAFSFIDPRAFLLIIVVLSLYIFWAISKNYRYVKNWRAFFILPSLQFTSDVAVIYGTTRGLLSR